VSQLYLVRHAQASFLSDDYDRLSELGHEQSKLLGDLWVRHNLKFDAVFIGPCLRHRQTFEGIRAGFADAGYELAEPSVLAGLDEYPADQIVVSLLPRLIEARADLAELAKLAQSAEDRRERGRALDKLLQQALRAWAEGGELGSGAPESWSGFVLRVQSAFFELTRAEASGQQILAVSSAGTIGAIVGHVLGASPSVTLELGWAINNAAVSEIVFSAGRANLSRFNVLAHLNEPWNWTRR
jgi:broad specificity phosphatase PhoE